MKDFSIQIATENGTGSMTANKILLRALIAEGYKASSKNLFPSNIAGLPTNFHIRISDYLGSSINEKVNLYIGFNKKTLEQDLAKLSADTFCILNANFKFDCLFKNQIQIDCRAKVRGLHDSASTKKLLYNMLYVGSTLKLLGCSLEKAKSISSVFFKKLPLDVTEANLKALEAGYNLVSNTINLKVSNDSSQDSQPSPKYLFEGNACSALGFLDGGANVVTWYPITPSSSVAENFSLLNEKYKTKHRSVLQCEDEISAAVAALGAGWSGARAFTATSGPGLSLMQEAIGLGYFTESPFVILDVQRAGPSTGLPTRTSQSDLLLAHFSSHGDTIHPVLLPGTPQECYDDSFNSLNLSHWLQTPVLILSDLDLGMNEWLTNKPIQQSKSPLTQGPLQIKNIENFKRYSNDDLVPRRSVPRMSDLELSYFTRGSGHDEKGSYTEDPKVYERKLSRLKDKVMKSTNNHTIYPADIIETKNSKISIVTWGSSGQIKEELEELLPFEFSYMRMRSLPISAKQIEFLKDHQTNFIVEQNRDGQMAKIIKAFTPNDANLKTVSICQFNGLPISAEHVASQILEASHD